MLLENQSRFDVPNEMPVAIALGYVPGWTGLRKFGMHDTVSGSNVWEDVWPIGTPRVLPTSAGVVACVSTSAEDNENEATPPGTGAFYIRIEGLDANLLEITEDVALTGTTPVNTTKQFYRVNRAYVILSGTNQANVGNITMSIGGAAQAFIEDGEGQTHQVMYTVPANKKLIIKQYRWVVGRMAGASDIQVAGQVRVLGTNTWLFISDIYAYGPQVYNNDFGVTVIPSGAEVRLQTNSSAATEISAVFAGYLVENRVLPGG